MKKKDEWEKLCFIPKLTAAPKKTIKVSTHTELLIDRALKKGEKRAETLIEQSIVLYKTTKS